MGKYFFKSRAPFLVCPQCTKKEFGVLTIGGLYCVRRCNNCDHAKRFDLPKPDKKLIYLDQNAISLIVKVPLGRAPPKWADVRTTLEHALGMEAIICPHSEYHESESVLDKTFAEELRKVYQRFAQGDAFRTSYEVQLWQIAQALEDFSKEKSREKSKWEDILRNDPNVWAGDLYITMNTGRLENVAKTARHVKDQISERLDDLNKTFGEDKKTFEEQRVLEIRQVALNMIEIYKKEIAALKACKNPAELITTHLEGSIFTEHMRYVLKFFSDRGHTDTEKKWEMATAFLNSDVFAQMNYVRVSSALWAGLVRRVGLGQHKVTASDFNDVPIISLYAPYCDAMFIDNSMRDLLTTNPVKDCLKLKTRFFSANCLDEFIAYIKQIEEELPAEFVKAVHGVHDGSGERSGT